MNKVLTSSIRHLGFGIAVTVAILTPVAIYKTIQNKRQLDKLEAKGRKKRVALNDEQLLLSQYKSHVNETLQSKVCYLKNLKCSHHLNLYIKQILSLSATQIRQQIISGDLKCIDVIITYCLVCDKANSKVNALFEKHYDSAIIDAQNLDKILTVKRKASSQEFQQFVSTKSLLGVPISIKDVFEMKDSDSTNGTLNNCDNKCESDGAVLQIIRENGGIPFCKTSVPQLLMMPETRNNIIGDTFNPHDISRSCGGSSGGEGAIIGAKGSILGVGGDVGGSLRIPAHFNGIMAYKPSSKRTLGIGKIWAYKTNKKQRHTGKFAMLPSVGPMARNMDDIILFLKSLWTPKAFELDMYCAPIPFRNNMFVVSYKPKLNIGYWTTDGWFTPTKCVKRAVELCVDQLSKNYNYNLIPMEFDQGKKVLEMYLKYSYAQGNMTKYVNALVGEPLQPQFVRMKFFTDIPNAIKKWIFNPLMRYFGERRMAFVTERVAKNGGLTVKELEDVMYEIMEFRYEFWNWVDSTKVNEADDSKIDVILTPVCYFPALPVGFSGDLSTSLTATFLQNVLDCAAGSIGPITFVQEDECGYDINALPVEQRDKMSKKLNEFMKGAKGLPINVQVFGRPFDDEIVLRVMKELEILFTKENRG